MKKILNTILITGSILSVLGLNQSANADNIQNSPSTSVSTVTNVPTEPATSPIKVANNVYQIGVQNVVDFNALTWVENELAQTNGQYTLDRKATVGIVNYSNATVYSFAIKDSQGHDHRITLKVIQDSNAPVKQLTD